MQHGYKNSHGSRLTHVTSRREMAGKTTDQYRERKCADTIGTVLLPCMVWPFPMLKYQYIFPTKYTEIISPNSTRKLLWFEIAV